MNLIIENGIIITPHDSYQADLGIENGKIVKIGNLREEVAVKRIDAGGQYIFPGIIDVHTHIDHWGGGAKTDDDFFTGTRAAACGGVTTLIDFAMQKKGEFVKDSIARRRKAADDKVCIDYSLHCNLTDLSAGSFNAIPEIINSGYTTFKLFMTYRKAGFIVEDGVLYETLQKVHENGGVVGIHAENDSICEHLTAKLIEQGLCSPKYHPESRPNITEAECISKAILFAKHTKTSLYIFHLTTEEGAELVKEARIQGVSVISETCPHYLTMTKEKYEEEDGQNYIMTPPLREKKDVDALWTGIQKGYVSIVSSDHCSFTSRQKEIGKDCFSKVTPGIPGTETLLPLVYHHGVNAGRITVNKLVEVLCFNPARMFGLYPEKGTIRVGSDADLVIFNPTEEVVLSAKTLNMATDYTPYEGTKVKGYPLWTIAKGEVIVENRKFRGRKGAGQFIARKKPELI